MRFTLPLAALALVAVQAQAQTPSTAPPAASPPAMSAPAAPSTDSTAPMPSAGSHRAHARMSLQQRFDQANTTHDGQLTLDQAKAGMPGIARHFDAIDKDKKGYVTVDEIRAYAAQRRAHHTAAHHPSTSS